MALGGLNLADALFTRAWLEAGLATEANPIMRAAWERSPAAFLASKAALVGAAILLLWRHRRRALAGFALLGSAALYLAVVAYHLVFLGTRLLIQSSVVP